MAGSGSFTKQWHNTSYSSISPSSPALSLSGKTVLITGGGSGIGARAVRSFAEAGAAHLGIFGRTKSTLDQTANELGASFPNTKFHTLVVSIDDETALNAAFEDFVKKARKIDVLVSNAAFAEMNPPVKDLETSSWQHSMQTNINGQFFLAKAYLSGFGKEDGVVINVSSALNFLLGPSFTAYAVSKEASVRMWQIVSMENPKLRVVSAHPGMVETDMSKKSGLPPHNDASLPADFFVWLTSSEAAFLDGKFVFANWDVEELKARQEEIKEKKLCEMWLNGYPVA